MRILDFQISVSDSSLVVRMDASQAFDPGSSPGYRIKFFFNLIMVIIIKQKDIYNQIYFQMIFIQRKAILLYFF